MRDVVYVDANRLLFFDVPVRTLYLRSVLVPCVLISPSRRHGSPHVREGRKRCVRFPAHLPDRTGQWTL